MIDLKPCPFCVGCGHDKRVKPNAEYHDPDARELYDWIEDKTDHADQ